MAEFDPQAWTAPKAPGLVGEFEQNDRLGKARLIATPNHGPEDVAVDSAGYIYAGTEEGSVIRLWRDGSARVVAKVGGRPLGVEIYGDDLLVCNADLGLQLVTRTGKVETLTDRHDDRTLTLTNNSTVCSDGTILFTESSQRWPLHDYEIDIVEGQPTGSLFQRSPDGTTTVLMDGLAFANGVALDAKEESVFVAETARYRINRYWLAGDKAGTSEVFRDNLPGFPDNMSFSNETLWVAFASPRNPQVDAMSSKPLLKKIALRMPDALKPKPLRHGMIVGFDDGGSVTQNLQDPSGRLAITTGVREMNGSLYIGVLTDPHVAVLTL